MLKKTQNTSRVAGLVMGIGLLSAAILQALPGPAVTQTYIVQGASLAVARQAVQTAEIKQRDKTEGQV